MSPQRFRKKPVVIEAMEVTRGNLVTAAEWAGAREYWGSDSPSPGVFIETLEGVMKANVGDFIIRGIQGEFYPCKPDIFAATYEAVK